MAAARAAGERRAVYTPQPVQPPALDPGVLSGTPYRLLRVLGSGGMGTVVETLHERRQSVVVLKLLHPELSERPDFADRLRIEALALANIEHPNLVRVHDYGITASGAPYLEMEKLEGRSLSEELAERGALPPREAIDLVCQALDGLGAAHARGFIHRDVKPANLFVCPTPAGPRVKVLDFGIAKVLTEADLGALAPKYRTQEGIRLGTPRYIAPEQLRGSVLTPATDVYAAGLVLYRALVGDHPFGGLPSVDAIYRAQLLEMPPPPSQRAPHPLPPELDRAVLRAVAKAPGDRFQSAEAFATELRRIAAGVPGGGDLAPDSRSAPTLASDVTALPARALEPLPAPPRSGPRPETIGVLALAAALLDLLWRAYRGFFGLTLLLQPLTFAPELERAPAPDEVESAELWIRVSGAASILEALLLACVSGSLAWLALRLLRVRSEALPSARRWTGWALIGIAAALPLDALWLVATLLGTSALPLGDLAPVTLGISFVFGAAVVALAPLVQVALVLLLRRAIPAVRE